MFSILYAKVQISFGSMLLEWDKNNTFTDYLTSEPLQIPCFFVILRPNFKEISLNSPWIIHEKRLNSWNPIISLPQKRSPALPKHAKVWRFSANLSLSLSI